MNTEKPIRMPVGYEIFAEIIERDFYFVDKSLLVQAVLDDPSKVILITRPRRFGKTLNLSMLHHFFAADAFGRKTEHLFDGLNIAQTDCMSHQGKYPVIFMTLKDIGDLSFKHAYARFCIQLSSLYEEYTYLLSSPKLQDHQKEGFEKILKKTANQDETMNALKDLSYYLFLHHGQRVWILIDEYDSPIHAAFLHGYYDEMINLMRGFFGAAFKTNVYLERAVITGILRVAKEGLFSGLNNLIVSSLLSQTYAPYFGFTEAEVTDVFDRTALILPAQDVKNWYNGYKIGDVTLYNPWSIVNCVRSQGKLDVYWVNTGGTQLIQKLIAHADLAFKQDLQQLLAGKTIDLTINEYVLFADLHSDKDTIWSLLFMAGYLKLIRQEQQEDHSTLSTLAIPNQEILSLYRSMIQSWLSNSDSATDYHHFLKHLLMCNADNLHDLEKLLSNILINIASFHDMAREPEAFYQGFLLGLTAGLSALKYTVKSNKESGLGYYDLVIIPKDTTQLAIIIEIKNSKRASEKTLLQAANTAVEQIKNNQYSTECQHIGFKKIAYLGIAFSGKKLKMAYYRWTNTCI